MIVGVYDQVFAVYNGHFCNEYDNGVRHPPYILASHRTQRQTPPQNPATRHYQTIYNPIGKSFLVADGRWGARAAAGAMIHCSTSMPLASLTARRAAADMADFPPHDRILMPPVDRDLL